MDVTANNTWSNKERKKKREKRLCDGSTQMTQSSLSFPLSLYSALLDGDQQSSMMSIAL